MWKAGGVLLGIVALLGHPPATSAETASAFTAGELLELCNHWTAEVAGKASISSTKGVACEYWVLGIIQGIRAGQAAQTAGTDAPRWTCPRSDVRVGTAIRVVREYIEQRPDDWRLPAGRLAYVALTWAFPCEGTTP